MKKVRVFISYSHGDSWFAQRLEEALKERSIDVWIDKNEILVGDSLLGRIREGIDSSDFVCALISKNSINSRWVQSELEIALNQQIDDQKVKVLPLILEDGIKLPSFLVGKLYIDFSRKEYFDDGVKLIMRRLDREAVSHQLFGE
jgi:predicted nucleotide-binding protein